MGQRGCKGADKGGLPGQLVCPPPRPPSRPAPLTALLGTGAVLTGPGCGWGGHPGDSPLCWRTPEPRPPAGSGAALRRRRPGARCSGGLGPAQALPVSSDALGGSVLLPRPPLASSTLVCRFATVSSHLLFEGKDAAPRGAVTSRRPLAARRPMGAWEERLWPHRRGRPCHPGTAGRAA